MYRVWTTYYSILTIENLIEWRLQTLQLVLAMLETEKQFIMRWQGVMDLGLGYEIGASCLVGYAPMTQDTCCRSRFRYETIHKLLFSPKEAITNIYPKYMKEGFENMKYSHVLVSLGMRIK